MKFRPLTIRLLPFERILGVSALFALCLSGLYGVVPRSRWDFYIVQILGAADNYIIGLCVVAALMVLSATTKKDRLPEPLSQRLFGAVKDFNQQYLVPRALVTDARMLLSALLLLAVYGQLKHLIPFVNHTFYDNQLLASEELLLGGKLAGTYVQNWLEAILGSSAAPFMSWSYTAYYVYLTTIILVFILQRNRILANRFFVSFCLLWLLGALVSYAWPTLGPCYVRPELFSHLPETKVSILQQNLWIQKQALDANPYNHHAVYLIAAMPSLHLGVLMLGSFYLKYLSPWLSLLSTLMLVATGLATLYFGWHYVIDHIAALVLVLIVIWLGEKICPRCGKECHECKRPMVENRNLGC